MFALSSFKSHRLYGLGVIALTLWLTVVSPGAAFAQGQAEASNVAKLQAAVDADAQKLKAQADELARLRLELEQLKVNRNTNNNADAAASTLAGAPPVAGNPPPAPGNSATIGGVALPFSLPAKMTLKISGFVHADFAWRQASSDQLNSATGDPLNETRFLIRRARLRAELDYDWVGGLLELDGNTVNGATARVIGAEASVRWRGNNPDAPPYLAGTIGLFKIPFGFEVVQSDKDRLFAERSNVIRAVFPGEYDLGARLAGGWQFLRYAVAVMNGHPLGEKQYPGRDPLAAKDLVGRLGIDVDFAKKVFIVGGASAAAGYGFHKGTAATKDTLSWRDVNEDGLAQLNEIQVLRGQPATPSDKFARSALGGDLRVALEFAPGWRTTLYGELVWAKNYDRALLPSDPFSAGREQRQLGWYAALTQELSPFVMIGVRYDQYNPDKDSTDLRGGVAIPKNATYTSLDVALALRLPPHFRLICEYDRNTNALGRANNGAPASLKDDAVIVRGEAVF